MFQQRLLHDCALQWCSAQLLQQMHMHRTFCMDMVLFREVHHRCTSSGAQQQAVLHPCCGQCMRQQIGSSACCTRTAADVLQCFR
jgi:hypothetical protein